MAEEEKKLSASEQKKEDWMNSKWRPMMGWSYMLTCVCDFVIFPILWSVLQAITKGSVNVQWQPITLQGAGLYHIAMGAVLGLAAYGRTQEKMAGANNGGLGGSTGYTPPPPVSGSGFGGSGNAATTPTSSGTAFGAPSTGGFSAPATGFGSSPSTGAGSFGSGATSGFDSGGFAAPATTASGKKIVPEFEQPLK
jgi:hypothetical protein